MRPTIYVSAKKVFWILIFFALLLAALSAAVVLYKTVPGVAESRLFSNNPNLGFLNLFDLKREQSFGTWYTSSLLLLCAALSALISFARKSEGERYVNHWRVLSAVFLYLSVDEGTTIHEKMGPVARPILKSFGVELGGLLSHAWVVPAGILVLVFVLAYLKFFFDLPARQRILFLVSGFLYVGGAMGLEMLNGFVASVSGEQPGLAAILIPVAEESFEMLGVVVFAYALLSYIGSHHPETRLRIEGRKPGQTHAD